MSNLVKKLNTIYKADKDDISIIKPIYDLISNLEFESEDYLLIKEIISSLIRFLYPQKSNQMQIEQNYNPVDYSCINQNKQQTQIQISKQKLKQLQDQKHSYNILGRIMSYAENYSYLNLYKHKFQLFLVKDYKFQIVF